MEVVFKILRQITVDLRNKLYDVITLFKYISEVSTGEVEYSELENTYHT